MPVEDGAPGDSGRRMGVGLIVVLGILAMSVPVGVLAYWRFTVSERVLSEDITTLRSLGAALTMEQCVDETVRWAGTCRAMKSLCDASVERMMESCLEGHSRKPQCSDLGNEVMAGSFGFAECRDRHVTRKTKKACGMAYRAIANHCQRYGTGGS